MDEALLIAILQIIAIDIVLGGDNAIIIALACRNLPPRQKRFGVLWGTAGAIILRCILVFFATTLLTIPGLKLIGGVLLLWIGVKLLLEDDHIYESAVKQPPNLIGAVRTIIIADFVLSLDNSIAIAASAKGNNQLNLIVQVIGSGRIRHCRVVRDDRICGFAEEYGGTGFRVTTHLFHMITIILPDTINAMHRKIQVRTLDSNLRGGGWIENKRHA